MTVFENKTKQMADFLASIAPSGKDPRRGWCSCCGEKVDEQTFKNPLSLREYAISGMCQECQDEVWEEARRE